MQIKVLSWNIWGGKYLDQVIDFLKNEQADIIGLQEIIKDNNYNTAEIIAGKLGYNYTWDIIQNKGTYGMRDYGNAILTKHKIVKSKTHNLSLEPHRIAVEADVLIDNQLLHTFSTHLTHTHQKPSTLQDAQVDKLLAVSRKDKTILMGDFNATPESYAFKEISKHLNNSDPTLENTWSVYPDGCHDCSPKGIEMRLDYVFTSIDTVTKSPEVIYNKASDHLPISVVIEV